MLKHNHGVIAKPIAMALCVGMGCGNLHGFVEVQEMATSQQTHEGLRIAPYNDATRSPFALLIHDSPLTIHDVDRIVAVQVCDARND
jgi:hypothetical protein